MHLKSEDIMITLKQLPACQWGIWSLMKGGKKWEEKSDRGGLVKLKIPVRILPRHVRTSRAFPEQLWTKESTAINHIMFYIHIYCIYNIVYNVFYVGIRVRYAWNASYSVDSLPYEFRSLSSSLSFSDPQAFPLFIALLLWCSCPNLGCFASWKLFFSVSVLFDLAR